MATQVWTDNGQAYAAQAIDPATRAGLSTTFHGATGSGTTAAAPTDTTLTEHPEARDTVTVSRPAPDTVRFVFTRTFTGTRIANEAGVFTAATGGQLVARLQHATLNMLNGDTITYTFNLRLRDSSEP